MAAQDRPRQPPQTEPFEAVRARLAERIVRWTQGVEQFNTPHPALALYRHDAPGEATSCMLAPAVALTVQGTKRALLGNTVYAYNRHRFLLTTLNLPVVLRVAEASRDVPYLSLVLKLDPRVIAELAMQCNAPPQQRPQPDRGIALGDTTATLLEAFDRLLRLLDEPEAIPVLVPIIQREIYYRLLMSEQGGLLWQMASIGSRSHRIARAIDWLKSNFVQALHVHDLAARVQMSPSRFHHHFHNFTSMSPLQFQKWLRLNQARQLMLTEHMDASSAAFQVGYESPSQFSREYSRQFGAPPRRDIERLQSLHAIGSAASVSSGAASLRRRADAQLEGTDRAEQRA